MDFVYRFRSWQVVDGGTSATIWLGIGGLVLLGLGIHAFRYRIDPWLACYAATLVFLVANKVMSPQFIAWPAAIAAVLGRRWFALHLLLAVLTTAIFVVGGDLRDISWLIAVRNVVLVGTAAAAVVATVRSSEPARSQEVDIVVP